MHRKLISLILVIILIPAILLTSCKKSAAPTVDISELQPEDEIVAMQEEAIENTEEADTEADPTESADSVEETGEPEQDTATEEADTSEELQTEIVEETPEPTATPTPEPVETPQPVTLTPGKHIIQGGETLYRIAVTYGTTVEALAQANSITNPSLIHPGQELTIPLGTTVGPPSSPAPSTGGTIYIVKQGDNLFRIGLKYNYDQYYLARYNGIENISMIYVGQEIRIP